MLGGACNATTNICSYCLAVKAQMAATRGMSLYMGSGISLSFLMSYNDFLSSSCSRRELNRSADYIKIKTGEVDDPT